MSTGLDAGATTILTAGDPEGQDGRKAWNPVVGQPPAAIALPQSTREVVAAVNFARHKGLRVAAQGTGHNSAPLGPLGDTLLVKTARMRRVVVDPTARMARIEAGALWQDVADAAAAYGLAAPAGGPPNIGVVGYTIGGGIGWLSRTYGMSANNVESLDLVLADGRQIRADSCHDRDLFWAVRGGGGSFGVVTGMELHLLPITTVYAGLLWWPAESASDVLHAWHDLTRAGLPDEFTTAARLMRFPHVVGTPEPLRGRSFVVIDVVHLGPPAEADMLLTGLRVLAPCADTVQTIPAQALGRVHMEPDLTVPSVAAGLTLTAPPPKAIDEMIHAFKSAAGQPLQAIELRQLGGEIGRPRPQHGALSAIDADYAMFAEGRAPTRYAGMAVSAGIAATKAALAPWEARQMYLNLASTSRDPARFWPDGAYDRLRQIKSAVDPMNMIRSNHPVPPA